MKKLSIKQDLTNHIFKKKIDDLTTDIVISTVIKKIIQSNYRGSKLTLINFDKNIFKNAKYPLQTNFTKNKNELKFLEKTSKGKTLIVDKFLIKNHKIIKNFKIIVLDLFVNLNLVTNNLNTLNIC